MSQLNWQPVPASWGIIAPDIGRRVRFEHHGVKLAGKIIGQEPGCGAGFWVICADHDGAWYTKAKRGWFEVLA